jgi:SAM-dependent methyltransferase
VGHAGNAEPDDFTYDSIADGYARAVDTAPYNALYERPAMLAMLDPLPDLRGRRVLDAGCGSGWYAARLATRGARVAGVDRSPRMLAHARARLGGDAVLAAADLAGGLPFASASFDLALSALVLHYLRDWGGALGELRRVLAPRGRLILSTHHPTHEAERLEGLGFSVRYGEVQAVEEEWDDVGRVRFFRRSLGAIVGALHEGGFVVERRVEPVPTEAFRVARPDAYARLVRRPSFLIVQARADDR